MQGSKTILVPVDFQDASLEALATARKLAEKLDLEVVLLHTYTVPVVVYPGFEPFSVPGLAEGVITAAKGALDNLSADQGGLQSMLRSGDPATEILRAIDETKPALVVMGTHGRKGFSHLLLGSVAEKVVRSSQAPVLTVHAKEA